MGTRADFYVGNGVTAEWKASIAYGGYPSGIDDALLTARAEEEYLAALRTFLVERDDVSGPDHGWPWPWNDSHTTDYAYCFIDGRVEAYSFGHGPFDPTVEDAEGDVHRVGEKALFPDMTHVQNVTLGKRSGLLIMQT